jgi:anti-sigma regulatory factor (Ser/Thr protein kinase)
VTALAIDLPDDLAAAAGARDAVGPLLHRLGMSADRVRDGLLVVSELVTNAVRHGRPPARLEVTGEPGRVLLRVHDAAPRPPAPRAATGDRPGGRGLHLVAALTADWGCTPHRDGPGKYVWAELAW